MFKSLLRPFMLSNQLLLVFPARTCDIKWFSLSSIYFGKSLSFSLRPTTRPYAMYFKMMYPRLKDKHPNLGVHEITKFAAEEWNQLSEAEKEEYRKICKYKMIEYEADDVKQEIESMRKEIEEILHDRPVKYRYSSHVYFIDAMKNNKVSVDVSLKKASKEFKAMNEKERSILEKKFEETQQDFEKWKQKVKKDGRAKLMKDLESNLSERLKSLQFDKPKRFTPPHACYLQQNCKSFKGSTNQNKLQECNKQWKNLSAAEKEPYYESLNKYNKDMIVWKETTSQDGRMEVIQAIKKLLYKLKL